MHLQDTEIFLGSRVTSFSRDPSHHIKSPGVVHTNVGQNVTPHNPSLGLFLYRFLHTMSLWCHESIHNNTNNQQTPLPWWWSCLPLQWRGFDESTPSKWQAALPCLFRGHCQRILAESINWDRNQYFFLLTLCFIELGFNRLQQWWRKRHPLLVVAANNIRLD